jgi:putative transposase
VRRQKLQYWLIELVWVLHIQPVRGVRKLDALRPRATTAGDCRAAKHRTQGWRLFWRWKCRSRGGRSQLSPEIQELIATMSREYRLWGTERIPGELLKLGIVVSHRSIRRYRWRGPARPPSQTWRTFLRNHAHHSWAADLLSVQTLTFKTLYVLVFIAHSRRELVHVNVTSNPTAAWV